MRIVHVLTRLLRAGSEENTLMTCRGQLEKGHEVIVLHGRESTPDHARSLAPGAEFIAIPALRREVRPLDDVTAFVQLRRAFERLSPDVVHTHQSKAGIVGRFAARAAGVPLIVHGVHILPFLGETGAKKTAYLLAERGAARVTDAFIHVSEGMKTACLTHRVGVGRPHHVVWSGFDLQRFAKAQPPEDWPEILGVDAESPRPPVITMVSSLEPRKNHLELIDHLPRLFDRFPDVRIVLAGEGSMQDPIRARIAGMGLQDRVRLLGFRSDPERLIAMSDICVHCSAREGLPRVVLQYLVAGRPVVMFHLPGIEDVATDGQNARIVPQNDWGAFLDALSGLLADPEARRRMSGGSDLSRWDGALMGEATLAVYRAHAKARP